MALEFLLVVEFALCAFTGLSLLGPLRRRNPANTQFGLFFLLYALVFLDRWTLASGWYQVHPWSIEWLTAFEIGAAGGALSWRSNPVRGSRRTWQAGARHLIPIVLATLCRVPLLILPGAAKLRWEDVATASVLRDALSQGAMTPAAWLEVFGILADIVFLAALVIYFVAALRLLPWHRRRLADLLSSPENRALPWLTQFLGVFGVLWLIYVIAGDPQYLDAPVGGLLLIVEFSALLVLALGAIAQDGLYSDEELRTLRQLEDGETAEAAASPGEHRYRRSGLSEQDMIRIAAKLDHAMQDERWYLESTLSLPQLAKRLGVSANYLSQTINTQKAMRFHDYVNGLRISEAAELLLHDPKLAIIDVAMSCGFNSKSTFNAAFKRLAGRTPSEFRRQGRPLDSGADRHGQNPRDHQRSG